MLDLLKVQVWCNWVEIYQQNMIEFNEMKIDIMIIPQCPNNLKLIQLNFLNK